jgi:hypothetical protein
MVRIYIVAFSILLFSPLLRAATDCSFSKWDVYQKTQLLREKEKGPYLFVTRAVKVDADGAPNAYHPDDVGLKCTKGTGFKGLDCPANGGYPKETWWRSAIVPDPQNNNKGYIQPSGAYQGFFVSRTSLTDKHKADIDPQKYVDSTSVPYLVFPGKFSSKSGTGSVGDFGFAINLDTGKSSPFIVAETGPPDAHLGEMSISLGVALGGSTPNPRTGSGAPKGKIAYVVFPYTKETPAWPVAQDGIEGKVKGLLDSVGGVEVLKTCAESL